MEIAITVRQPIAHGWFVVFATPDGGAVTRRLIGEWDDKTVPDPADYGLPAKEGWAPIRADCCHVFDTASGLLEPGDFYPGGERGDDAILITPQAEKLIMQPEEFDLKGSKVTLRAEAAAALGTLRGV